MMELEASLWDVVKAGNECALTTIAKKQHSHSPPYPNALLFIHTLHVFTMYRTAMGWPVKANGIYKYVQNVPQDHEKEGNCNFPKWGFNWGCLNTV